MPSRPGGWTWRSVERGRSAARPTGSVSGIDSCLPATAAAGTVAPAGAATASVAARGRRLGDLDGQCACAERRAVELPDGLIGRLGRGHLDKAEAARLAGLAIGHDRDTLAARGLVEELAQLVGRGAEGKAANEKLLTHESSPDSAVDHAPWNGGSERKAWTDGEGDHHGQRPEPDTAAYHAVSKRA